MVLLITFFPTLTIFNVNDIFGTLG